MKSPLRRFAALAAATTTAAVSSFSAIAPAMAASQFGQKEVDQSDFVAVAAPYQNGNAHQLLILEQVSDSRKCWDETGNSPTLVDPLLLNFDFTGICDRKTDSNGYSIRMNGEDLGLRYSLRVVRRDGNMLLVGQPGSREAEEIVVGRSTGVTTDFAKIALDPGWRFTKRTYGDRTLGHIYLTYDGNAPALPGNPTLPTDPQARFPDTAGDIYLAEINQAVTTGFIAGFSEDNTFRPQATLTREQLVSMVLGAIDSLPNVNLSIPTQAGSSPYSDVESGRWSAAKIQFARDNNIVSGYQDGSFRPSQPVTRAEMMAVLRRSAEYAKGLQGQAVQLQGNRPAATFADTNGHWANSLITQMSSYCGVASPLNERGANFAPDSQSQRNYAAAATLRMLNCVSGQTTTAEGQR